MGQRMRENGEGVLSAAPPRPPLQWHHPTLLEERGEPRGAGGARGRWVSEMG